MASEQSLSGRALAMRDDAFEQLGDTDLADLDVEGDTPQFVQNPDIPDSVDGDGRSTSTAGETSSPAPRAIRASARTARATAPRGG